MGTLSHLHIPCFHILKFRLVTLNAKKILPILKS